jgi:hypothetical protein
MKKGVHFLAKGVVKMYGCKAAEKEKFMSVEAVYESGLRLHQTAATDAREDRYIGGLMVAQPNSALRRLD